MMISMYFKGILKVENHSLSTFKFTINLNIDDDLESSKTSVNPRKSIKLIQ